MIVAAVAVTSNLLAFSSTTVTTASINLTDTGGSATDSTTGNAALYNFNANIVQPMTASTFTVTIQKSTAMSVGDVASVNVTWDAVSHPMTLGSISGGNTITATFVAGSHAAGATNAGIITVLYTQPGSYTVKVQLTGTA